VGGKICGVRRKHNSTCGTLAGAAGRNTKIEGGGIFFAESGRSLDGLGSDANVGALPRRLQQNIAGVGWLVVGNMWRTYM
jgi:hypothetical protein